MGTIRLVAKRSRLKPYPATISSGQEHVRALSGCRINACVSALLCVGALPMGIAKAQPAEACVQPAPAPPFKQLRYDEDYAYLRDNACRAAPLDGIKLIPLGADGARSLTLGGEVRQRYEYYDNSLWGLGPQDNDGYFLQRLMIHADVHFGDSLRLFTQLKSGLESGRTGGPRPTDKDRLDLGQAFFDFRPAGSPVTLRIGRQEMSYGSSRLVSFREGPNVRLAFDGVKAMVELPRWQVDMFATRPVQTKPDTFDDRGDPKTDFWGVYAVTPVAWLPSGHADIYYLGLDRRDAHFDQGTADERRDTLGTRLWGKTERWDYNLELVYQFGTFGSGDIRAWTVASDVGFTFTNARFRPRLGLKANVTSGDRDPKDSDLQTFNPLFPKGSYFGEPALIGPSNHVDVHPQLDLALRDRLTLTIDWDWFWRQDKHDAIYGPAVNVLLSGAASDARYVGDQLELALEWDVNRHVTFTGDYARFYAGDFLKEASPGKDVGYFSAWVTFKF